MLFFLFRIYDSSEAIVLSKLFSKLLNRAKIGQRDGSGGELNFYWVL